MSQDHLSYPIVYAEWEILNNLVSDRIPSNIFVIVDENTKQHCYPIFQSRFEHPHQCIEIKAGEQHKNLSTCAVVYDQLLKFGADRHSLCINLGGGVIGDLGGFCASTFMRGFDFIQIPTTVLAQVDASVGGKLGVDFQGVKNMVGLFNHPEMVFIEVGFLKTLPGDELRSGYAEIIKHAIIYDRKLWQELCAKETWSDNINQAIIQWSVDIKSRVVAQDFKEGGIRKILNYGHTIGHAVETLSFDTEKPLLHGEAIAIGMICEAHIAWQLGLLEAPALDGITEYIVGIYGNQAEYLEDILKTMDLMKHDKKNKGNQILASLPSHIGHYTYDVAIDQALVENAFMYYRDQ